MKKYIFAVLFLLISVSGYCANDWKIIIKEVRTPSLTEIQIQYILLLNGKDYVSRDITINSEEFTGTISEKKSMVFTKIKNQCKEYISVYNAVKGLKEALENQEVIAQ